MSFILKIGDVIKVKYPRRVPKGHEQEGERPALIIGIPDLLDTPRYPVLVTIPLTTNTDIWSDKNKLYIKLSKGEANLTSESILITDQVLTIDATRIIGYIGSLSGKKITLVKDKIKTIFDMNN